MPVWPVSFKFSVVWSARSDLGLEVSLGLLPGSVLGWAATSLWHSELSPAATGCTQTLSYCPVNQLVLGRFGPLLRSLQVCIPSIWLLFQPALSILFKPLVAVKTGQSQRPQAAHTLDLPGCAAVSDLIIHGAGACAVIRPSSHVLPVPSPGILLETRDPVCSIS